MADHVVTERHLRPTLDNPVSRVSWASIFAGLVVAVVTQVLINMLFVGIGLHSIDPATQQNPLNGLASGATWTLILSNAVALFLGAYVTGRLAGTPRSFPSVMHGVLVWALLSVLSFFLITSAAGRVLNGVTNAVGQGLSLAGQGVTALAPQAAQAVEDQLARQGIGIEDIRAEIREIIDDADIFDNQPTTTQAQAQAATANVRDTATDALLNPRRAQREINTLLDSLTARGENLANSAERDDLIEAVAENTDLSRVQAEQTVDGWIATLEDTQTQLAQARQDLERATQEATNRLGSMAIWALIGLLIGAAVAALGSYVGSPTDTYEARVARH